MPICLTKRPILPKNEIFVDGGGSVDCTSANPEGGGANVSPPGVIAIELTSGAKNGNFFVQSEKRKLNVFAVTILGLVSKILKS